MIRSGVLLVGLVALLGLAGCNETRRGYGYGNNYRPSAGGNYNRGYDNRQRDDRGRGPRGYEQNSRNRPPAAPARGAPSRNIFDQPANHPGN